MLATVHDRSIADPVARHLGIFDDVIASVETAPLVGEARARVLADRFGERGFVYAGNCKRDLPRKAATELIRASADLNLGPLTR